MRIAKNFFQARRTAALVRHFKKDRLSISQITARLQADTSANAARVLGRMSHLSIIAVMKQAGSVDARVWMINLRALQPNLHQALLKSLNSPSLSAHRILG